MLLALSGCAGWLDPMVAAGDRPKAPTLLPMAIDYANRSKDKYFEAMSHQARLVSLTGVGLIPLAAATVGLAVYGNTVPVAALALTGASTYATALWLRNQPAQMAYLAGYQATNCAVLAVTPFAPATLTLVAGQEGEELNFVTALQGIPRQIGKVLTAASPLRRASDHDDDTAAALSAADMTIKEAAEARKNGLAVQAAARTLGDSLVVAVDRINAEVNGAVIRGQPDLGALASVVGGIGSVYQQFGQVPVTKVLPGPPKKGGEPEALTQASGVDDLRKETAILANMQTVVATTVNAVAALKPTDALAKCGGVADQTVAALSVVPVGPYSFPKGVAHTQGFVAQGGRSPYAATVVTATPEITLRQPEMFGPAFVIESTGKGKGTYPILIRDGGGRSLFVDVEMVEAPRVREDPIIQVPVDHKVPPCNERPGDPIANCATPDQIKAMQIAMCMPENLQDRKWGRLSREYLKRWISRNKPGVAPSDRLTKELKQELLQRSQNQGDLANDCGDQVLRENLRKLTDRTHGPLELPPPGVDSRVFLIFPETSVDGRRARIFLCQLRGGAATDDELISALLGKAKLPEDAIPLDAIVFFDRKTGKQVKAAAILSCQP